MSDDEKIQSVHTSDILLSCPCGKTPTRLLIDDGPPCKWAYVTGDCCSEWSVEFRTNYKATNSSACMALAIAAWNSTPRVRSSDDATKQQAILIETLSNRWFESAEEIAREHHSEERGSWDDDEAFGRYATLIDCRSELLKLIR